MTLIRLLAAIRNRVPRDEEVQNESENVDR